MRRPVASLPSVDRSGEQSPFLAQIGAETMDAVIQRSPGAKLRALLAEPGIMIAPGVYDGFSLRLVEQMGYRTAAITGAGISESNLGWADVGIMGYTENLRACSSLAAISS